MSREEKIKEALDTFILIKRHSNAAREIFMKNFDLNPSQVDILCLLKANSELTMKNIATLLNTTPGSITQLTEKLVDTGVIERKSDKDDRRVIKLAFTKKGVAFFNDLEQSRYEYGKVFLKDFSEAELETLISLHKKILAQISPQ